MDVALYLQRIGYTGPIEHSVDTLRRLQRGHLMSIPYENLDIHLGRRIVLDEAKIFQKIVIEKRGGWCFEMNGLMAGVLRELGFDVQLLSATVGSVPQGDDPGGGHLVLLVQLDRPYFVDVGFGDGFLEPIPLEVGDFRHGFLSYRLSKEGDRWMVHNHPGGRASQFNLTLQPYRFEEFAAKNHELQTSPTSGFVQTTVSYRFTSDSVLCLRGAILKIVDKDGVSEQVIDNQAQYEQTLRDRFDLDLGDLSDLWPRVWERHLAWAAAQNAS